MNLLILFLQILVIWFVWYIVGCGVLAAIDKDDRLLEWSKNCPLPGGHLLVVTFWPAVIYFYFRKKER